MKSGEEIALKPGMPEAEALCPGSAQAFFSFHADHGSRLQAEFHRLCLEQHLSANQADQFPVGVADRIDRIMANHGRFHRLDERHRPE